MSKIELLKIFKAKVSKKHAKNTFRAKKNRFFLAKIRVSFHTKVHYRYGVTSKLCSQASLRRYCAKLMKFASSEIDFFLAWRMILLQMNYHHATYVLSYMSAHNGFFQHVKVSTAKNNVWHCETKTSKKK